MDCYIRRRIPRDFLSESQRAYRKGRSGDTALHTSVSWLAEAIEAKDFVVGIFLDIEGAFKNVLPQAVVTALDGLGVESNLKHLTYSLSCDRVIETE